MRIVAFITQSLVIDQILRPRLKFLSRIPYPVLTSRRGWGIRTRTSGRWSAARRSLHAEGYVHQRDMRHVRGELRRVRWERVVVTGNVAYTCDALLPRALRDLRYVPYSE